VDPEVQRLSSRITELETQLGSIARTYKVGVRGRRGLLAKLFYAG
jgi:hypothetical protein